MGGAEYMKSIKKYETIINEALLQHLNTILPRDKLMNLSVFLENISGLTEFIFLRMTRSIM